MRFMSINNNYGRYMDEIRCGFGEGLNRGNFLIDNRILGSAYGLQPPLAKDGRFFWNSVKMAVVVGASVSRSELAIREATCCRHDKVWVAGAPCADASKGSRT